MSGVKSTVNPTPNTGRSLFFNHYIVLCHIGQAGFMLLWCLGAQLKGMVIPMKTKLPILLIVIIQLLSLISCTPSNKDVLPSETSSSQPTEVETDANVIESNNEGSDENTEENMEGNFWSGRSASDFIITQQGDWLYYSYAHVNSSFSPSISYVGKIPVNWENGSAVELYRSDEGHLYFLQVVGKGIYWSTEEGIYRMTTDGTDLTCVVSNIANEAFYVSGDWIYYTESIIEQISASSKKEYNYFSRISIDGASKEVLYTPEKQGTSLFIAAAISGQQIYFIEYFQGERTFYLFDGSKANSCAAGYDDLKQDEDGNLYYLYEDTWYCASTPDLSSGVAFCPSLGLNASSSFFAYSSSFFYKQTDQKPSGIYKTEGPESENIVILNQDSTCFGNGITSPGDGYLYYVASGNFSEDEIFCRMLPDGSGWENISSLLNIIES